MINVNGTPAYPAADDIRYAVWLKNLAIRLPDYASRYQLTSHKVLEMHCLALDYIELLVDRMHQATAHICLGSREPSAKEQPRDERALFMQKIVAELVAYIMQHPAYVPTDAHELCLPPFGHPISSSQFFPHSPTTPLLR